MYDENGSDWTLMTVLLLVVMFTALGGWDFIIGWWEKIYGKTPNVVRKMLYAVLMVTAFYLAIRYV